MAKRNIVVVGASAGGVEALKRLCAALPRELEASILIVLHTGESGPNLLDSILSRAGPLPVSLARDGSSLEPGRVVVAPSACHLVVDGDGRLRLTQAPRENRFRPSIDVLFRSAALAYGPRVVGVVLTGRLDDGAAGLEAIKARGGVAIVQDPREALEPAMPRHALNRVDVDHCVPLAAIPGLIVSLAASDADEKGAMPVSRLMRSEVEIALGRDPRETAFFEDVAPSPYACPECHGVLFEIDDPAGERYRCHTGHAYSTPSLLAEFEEQNEKTLWSALRSLEETVVLLRSVADSLARQGTPAEAARFSLRAEEARRRAETLRDVLLRDDAEVPAAAMPGIA